MHSVLRAYETIRAEVEFNLESEKKKQASGGSAPSDVRDLACKIPSKCLNSRSTGPN